MKIKNVIIKNYRLLKNFSIDLEDELSLVVGKNNTGKTSLLTVMSKFLNSSDTVMITITSAIAITITISIAID